MFAKQRQQKTMLYHGVSAMAMKGLVDMGANIGSDDQSFSQLPTQSVCVVSPSAPRAWPVQQLSGWSPSCRAYKQCAVLPSLGWGARVGLVR